MIGIVVSILLSEDGSPRTLEALHHNFPLLWIIDTAPFVLAIVSYMVGTRVKRSSSKLSAEIRHANKKLQVQNEMLQGLIQEKEVLLKEIHHRVKNNLQVITSLLSLQSSFIENDATKALFRYSQYRINSMALIHEMLYQSDDISRINYNLYVEKLVTGLISSMRGTDHGINVEVDVSKIELNIDTAIPLGLLINEIVTNSLKYGIKANDSGSIYLSIRQTKYPHFLMLVGDNGAGFSEEINFRTAKSLGLILIHKLVLQLKGNIEKDNSKPGTNYIINFQEIDQTS